VILSGVIPIASGGTVSLIAPALSSHWIMDSLAVTTRLIKINLIKDQDLLDRWEVTTATFDLGILISVLMALLLISASFVSLSKRN
jgi:hypothetical protein